MHAHPVDYISAACLLVRRQLFLDLGLFDPRFEPAYYEDTDAALVHLRHGWLTISQPLSVVVHSDEVAKKSFDAPRKAELMRRNRRLFATKHAALLRLFCPPAECAHRYLGTTFNFYAKERVHILVLADAIPDMVGPTNRLSRLVRALVLGGYKLSMELVDFDAALAHGKSSAVSLVGSGVYLHPLGTLKRLSLYRSRHSSSSASCAWDAVIVADADALRHFRSTLPTVCPELLVILDADVGKAGRASLGSLGNVAFIVNASSAGAAGAAGGAKELVVPDAALLASPVPAAAVALERALRGAGLPGPASPGAAITRPCPGVAEPNATSLSSLAAGKSTAAESRFQPIGAAAGNRSASLPGACHDCWYCSHNAYFYMPPALVALGIEPW
jgi:hypothetical protein